MQVSSLLPKLTKTIKPISSAPRFKGLFDIGPLLSEDQWQHVKGGKEETYPQPLKDFLDKLASKGFIRDFVRLLVQKKTNQKVLVLDDFHPDNPDSGNHSAVVKSIFRQQAYYLLDRMISEEKVQSFDAAQNIPTWVDDPAAQDAKWEPQKPWFQEFNTFRPQPRRQTYFPMAAYPLAQNTQMMNYYLLMQNSGGAFPRMNYSPFMTQQAHIPYHLRQQPARTQFNTTVYSAASPGNTTSAPT